MLAKLCHELKNWFEKTKYIGEFTISNGNIYGRSGQPIEIQTDQYFRIIGSIFNDGVYKYPASSLKNESFEGAIWALAIPQEIIDLSNDIANWVEKYGGVDSTAMSPFNSESFGGYSYSKSGGGASDGKSNAGTWQAVFRAELNKWRKI